MKVPKEWEYACNHAIEELTYASVDLTPHIENVVAFLNGREISYVTSADTQEGKITRLKIDKNNEEICWNHKGNIMYKILYGDVRIFRLRKDREGYDN